MLVRRVNFEHRGIRVIDGVEDSHEHITIDLHAGDIYYNPGILTPIAFNEPIPIKPGKCIVIETKECIQLPKNIFGILCSKGSLSAIGVVVSNNKIDPLFNGKLNVPVFNAGSSKVIIQPSQAFCCTAFHLVEAEVPSDTPRNAIRPTPHPKDKFADLIETYLPSIVTILIAILGAAVATAITLWFGK